jgi:hypothetical protein
VFDCSSCGGRAHFTDGISVTKLFCVVGRNRCHLRNRCQSRGRCQPAAILLGYCASSTTGVVEQNASKLVVDPLLTYVEPLHTRFEDNENSPPVT